MKDVPLTIAGSASGVLNTMRSLGQVLGIAVLGSVLQTRLAVDMGTRLTGSPLPVAVRDHLATLAGGIRIEEFPAALGQAYAQLLPAVMADLQWALLIENPDAKALRAPAPEQAARVDAEASATPAD
jgi:hypothetical protein